jgi:hypothetical protein
VKGYDSCFFITLLMSAVIILAGTVQIYVKQNTVVASAELDGIAIRLL